MENLQRKQNENEYEHHKRLILGKLVDKTLSDIDYTELSKEVYGKEYSSDVARRMMYGSRDTIQLLEKNSINNIEDEELLSTIEEKQRELKKERIKLSTEKLEYNKWLREQSRAEMLHDNITQAVINYTKPLTPPSSITIRQDNKKAMVLAFGDIHFGKEFVIKDFKGNIINEFNEEIFESRMWKIFDETISKAKIENASHVDIFNCGDNIEGIIRGGSSLMSLKYGIVDGAMKFTNFMANWLNEMSKYITINYHQSMANHEDLRVVSGKKGDYPHENISRMIMWTLKSILRDNPNINFVEEQVQGLTYTNIIGFDFLITHGDKEKNLENSVKDYTQFYNANIDYLVVGHKHFSNNINFTVGKEILQLPSVVGCCEYAQTLKKSSDPQAKIFIFEENVGRTTEYVINLNK